MSARARLAFGAAAGVALLVGLGLGLWLGGRIEQEALVALITRPEITAECRDQLHRAVKAVIEDFEGPPAP